MPIVFKISIATYQYFSSFFAEFHRAIPFQAKDHITSTTNSIDPESG